MTSFLCSRHRVTWQARSMVPQQGDKERHRFFVGTNSVREKNEVCVASQVYSMPNFLLPYFFINYASLVALCCHSVSYRFT